MTVLPPNEHSHVSTPLKRSLFLVEHFMIRTFLDFVVGCLTFVESGSHVGQADLELGSPGHHVSDMSNIFNLQHISEIYDSPFSAPEWWHYCHVPWAKMLLSVLLRKKREGSLMLLTYHEHIHARLFRVETKMKLFSPWEADLRKYCLLVSQMFLAADGSLALNNFYQWWSTCEAWSAKPSGVYIFHTVWPPCSNMLDIDA